MCVYVMAQTLVVQLLSCVSVRREGGREGERRAGGRAGDYVLLQMSQCDTAHDAACITINKAEHNSIYEQKQQKQIRKAGKQTISAISVAVLALL